MKTKIKVHSAENEKAGIIHNPDFTTWFEIGRAELLKSIDFDFARLEREGMLMLLSEVKIKFHATPHYDDTHTLSTLIRGMPVACLIFNYIIDDQTGRRIAAGESTHALVNSKTRKPVRIPEFITRKVEGHF